MPERKRVLRTVRKLESRLPDSTTTSLEFGRIGNSNWLTICVPNEGIGMVFVEDLNLKACPGGC
jgi:hypothetical protein